MKVIHTGAESVHQNCVIGRCAHLHMATETTKEQGIAATKKTIDADTKLQKEIKRMKNNLKWNDGQPAFHFEK